MIAVGSDHPIARLAGCDQTRADAFLPDIQVHEPTDLASLIQLCAAFFDAADQHHLMIKIQ